MYIPWDFCETVKPCFHRIFGPGLFQDLAKQEMDGKREEWLKDGIDDRCALGFILNLIQTIQIYANESLQSYTPLETHTCKQT